MIKEKIQEAIFFIVFTFACLSTTSDKLKGYWGEKGPLSIIAIYLGIIIFVALATLLNKSNIKKISTISNYIVLTTSVLLIFDYYVTEISGSQLLFKIWWIGSIFVAEASLFLTITTLKPADYDEISKRFWIFFTPLYLFLMFICFVRTPFSSTAPSNFVLGKGTFELLVYFIHNPIHNFEPPLMVFGNLFVFIPLPFIINTFFRSISNRGILIIGGVTPLVIEGYQLFFKCGNTDIDDLVLNWAGFLIGYIFLLLITKRYKERPCD